MKKPFLIFNIVLVSAIWVLLQTSSCVPQRKLTLLQDLNKTETVDTSKISHSDTEYRLKPKDEIYIRINSIDPKTYQFFNNGEGSSSNNFNSEGGLYFNNYVLDDSGFVFLPVIGKIMISNLTAVESQSKIEDLLRSKYLSDVNVNVKLSGFKITLLGEVKKPGKQIAYVTRLNILEAIALGGDLTEFGNREKVMIIREINGVQTIQYINLLDRRIINDENYYLKPNDIIYVQALKAKTYGFSQAPYSFILSTVTSLIALYTIFKK